MKSISNHAKFRTYMLLVGLAFLCFSPRAFSQLSGYYTIGSAGGYYSNLSAAMSDLYNYGVNGDVIFALDSGYYSGISLNEIQGASNTSTITFQSASLDSTDVIISGTIDLNETSYITFKALTISTNGRAVDFLRSKHIFFKSCIINSNYQANLSGDATIYLKHNFVNQGEYSHITFDQCRITCSSPCIYCTGDNGSTTIDNCEFNSTGAMAIKTSLSLGQFSINNSILNGGVDINDAGYSDLVNNVFNGKIRILHLDSALNNTFNSNETIRITSGYMSKNHFCNQPADIWAYKFIDNYFEGNVDVSWATNIKMIGNIFLDGVHLSFNEALLFENNKVYGTLHYGDVATANWDYQIHNNIFIDGYVDARGHHSKIRYNNFVDSAFLYLAYSDILVYDNNFCRGIEGGTSPQNIDHNNYFPLTYCYYDTSSTHYDPCYDSLNPGISTNPILQGKGVHQVPSYDIFGNSRKFPPAIGANEIYICSDSTNNVITAPCGEEYYLNLCNLPDSGTFWWSPDTCVSSPNSSYTSTTASENTTLYLNNSYYGIVDSVFIEVEPFEVEIAPMPTFYCGYARTLNATYHPLASYTWSPPDGLTNPNIRTPDLLIEDTINFQYVLECSIPGCGISYDTLHIVYDPLPYIFMYYPQQQADSVYFSCFGECIDEYFWDFGDSTYSYEQNTYHTYQANGYYIITLIGTNSFGTDTVIYDSFHYYVLSTEKIENNTVQVYPNPVKDRLFIKGLPAGQSTNIKLLSISGAECFKTYTKSVETSIDLGDIKRGVYILQIIFDEGIISKKIIVLP